MPARAPATAPSAMVDGLAATMVERLHERLVDAIDGAGDDDTSVTQRLGARYREFKGQELDAIVGDTLAAAWALGVYDATPKGATLRWVAGGRGPVSGLRRQRARTHGEGRGVPHRAAAPAGAPRLPVPARPAILTRTRRARSPRPGRGLLGSGECASPVRRNRERRFRIRPWMVILVAVLVALFLSARSLAGFYTDYLWFDSVGFGSTWRGCCGRRFAPAAVFTIVFFVMMLVEPDDRRPHRAAHACARSRGRDARPLPADRGAVLGPHPDPRLAVLRAPRRARASPASGSAGSCSPTRRTSGSRTRSSTRTSASTCSGCRSCRSCSTGSSPALIVVLVITALAHYLNGGIRLQTPFQRVTPQVKAHLSVILALMALTKTVQYYLAPFRARTSRRAASSTARP